jgi:hypothetical protein
MSLLSSLMISLVIVLAPSGRDGTDTARSALDRLTGRLLGSRGHNGVMGG